MPRTPAKQVLPTFIFIGLSLIAFLTLDFLQWKKKEPGSVIFSWMRPAGEKTLEPLSLEKDILPLLRPFFGTSLDIREMEEKPSLKIKVQAPLDLYQKISPELEKKISNQNYHLEIKTLEENEKEALVCWFLKDKRSREASLLFQLIKPAPVLAQPPVPREKPVQPSFVAPAIPPRRKTAAIIIDDLGNSLDAIKSIIALRQPLTVSILPLTPFAQETAEMAHANGLEVMLHLPLESINHQENDGSSSIEINSRMAPDEIISTLQDFLKDLPYVQGVNNHMGSLATQDRTIMKIILAELKSRGLFFIDSRTSDKSIAYKLAREMDLPSGRRDIFLDATVERTLIEKQVRELIRLCQKRGSAIVIGHPYPETLEVLAETIPLIEKAGITLVPVSKLIFKENN